ncbi:helix-turn-helix domain-containing protein [Enterococcus plantarum]|uniref:helix-turn-helix domain-containing protein n=1 Tax=Enterococcus plantarum TaxID=1077675 RepID=UPI001A90CBDD|nr:helix-turn-helix domain-containing protein [Enterococcus plantarum]MBO0468081.1 helix-turn-helix domain-containing protein [Enterococcus plantarum]
MNEIEKRLIFDNILKRKLYILSLLIDSNEPISVFDLQKNYDVSIKTLQQDFLSIENALSSTVELTKSSNWSIRKIASPKAIQTYMYDLIQHNPIFILVDSLYEGKKEKVATFAEKHFISQSALRKHIDLLKDVLADYHLTLNTNPFELIGNEIDIRHFFFHYFNNNHRNWMNTFTDADFKLIDNFLNYIRDNYKQILTIDYYRFAQLIKISRNRIAQNNQVSFDSSLISTYSTHAGFKSIHSAIDWVSRNDTLYTDLSDSEIIYLYIIAINSVVYGKDSFYILDDLLPMLKTFNTIVDNFFKDLHYNFSANVELNLILKSYLSNLDMLSKFSTLFQTEQQDLKNIAIHEYPKTYENWLYYLEKYSDFHFKQDIATSLTLLTETNLKRDHIILFAISSTPIISEHLKNIAASVAPKEVQIHFVINQPVTENLIRFLHIDIVVANFAIPEDLSNIKSIQISSIPGEMEWMNLAKELRRYLS